MLPISLAVYIYIHIYRNTDTYLQHSEIFINQPI